MPRTKRVAAEAAPTPKSRASTGAMLDEQQLLAMPEDDYMNPAQQEFFRRRLQQMRQELSERAAERQRESGDGSGAFPDGTDRATAEEERFVAQRLGEREAALLRKVDEALQRLRDGRYGWCVKTGEPIGLPRLLARPTATLAVEAKSEDETRRAQFAG